MIGRIVLITKPTRLEELILIHHSEGAVRFLLEQQGDSIDGYKREHEAYRTAIAEIQKRIPSDVQLVKVTAEEIPHTLFREEDLVIICGPDGLFVNAARYVTKQLVLTVNPDPERIAGVLMLFPPTEVGDILAKVRVETHKTERIPLVKAAFEDGREVLGVNEIFLGRLDQRSARYSISIARNTERQMSSGVIVSTGVGSTGWISSIMAMVRGVANDAVYMPMLASTLEVSSEELIFVVREPFDSPETGTNLVCGRVNRARPIVLRSEMPQGGYVFSDGMLDQAVAWNAGDAVTVSIGEKHVQRIVP